MFSRFNDKSIFPRLETFLAIKGQYPFSLKRKLVNQVISLCSIFYHTPVEECYDVLLLLPAPELEDRYSHISKELSEHGVKCKTVFFSDRDIIKVSFLGALFTSLKLNAYFTIEKGYALFLKHKYTPKIILQFNDCSYLSVFLKRFSGAFLINIAHCVSCTTKNFDIFDFHYYLIFGNSSIDNLRQIQHAYGSCQLVKVGSCFLVEKNNTSVNEEAFVSCFVKHIVFSSQWLSEPIAEDIQWSRYIINQLAERNKNWKITIKCHPMETERGWICNRPNVFVELGNKDFRELLKDASFHITHHSAFALESSVCSVPTICIQRASFTEKCLSFQKYFPVVDNVVALEEVIHNKGKFSFDIEGFKKYHLSNIGCEAEAFTQVVIKTLQNEPIEGTLSLMGAYLD